MANVATIPSWRIVAAEIIAAMKADPESLRSIYEDQEFRPGRNASVWAQLAARLAQERKAYRKAVAGGYLKEVQHNMLRRCFAHDYNLPGSYMITLVVPERGTNPFGTVKGDVRQVAKDKENGRKGITLMPEEAKQYAGLQKGESPLRMEMTPLGAAVLQALEGIPANYPMVEVRKAQIMPDHLHLILEVTAPIVSSNGKARHLGHVIAGYKAGCNKARRLLFAQHNCATPNQQGATPNQQGATPNQQGATPNQQGATPNQQGATPNQQGATPNLQGATPNLQGAMNAGAEELCSSAYDGSATTPDPTFAPIWTEGYTDTIILSIRHMDTEEAYLDDNIYRLRMKQEHRDLLRRVLHIRINGHDFAALGNIHLLRKPLKEQVQFHHWEADVPAGYVPCDRSWGCRHFYLPSAQQTDTDASGRTDTDALGRTGTDASGRTDTYTLGSPIAGATEAEAHTERLLESGDGGAVFTSPFISETEKALRDAALTMGIPYIRLTREGFRDLYTPSRSEFEACCEGNVLLLAPWEDRRRTATITRRECMELNKVAAMIAGDDIEMTWIRKNDDDNDNTIIPRDDE